MKLHIILWRGIPTSKWSGGPDDMIEDAEVAELQLRLNRLKHPNWEFCMVEVDVPDRKSTAV